MRIYTKELLALENLSRTEGRPINQLVNEAIKSYLRPREKRSMGTNLSDLRAYRKKDPDFKKAMKEFVEAEANAARLKRQRIVSRARGTRLFPVVPMARHINHHGTGQDQHVVFTLRDLHSVGITEREPLF